MRKRIDAREININKRKYIYESPDGGKTIYKRQLYSSSAYTGTPYFGTSFIAGWRAGSESYDEVAFEGVKLDKHPDQLEFNFDNEQSQRIKKIEDILNKLNTLEAQVREIRKSLVELE